MSIEHRFVEQTIPSELDQSDPQVVELIASTNEQYRFAAAHCHGRRVLDVGCGSGFGTQLLRTEGYASVVVGIDIDPEIIEVAQRDYATDDVEYRHCAPSNLGEATFDCVVSLNTLKHVPDPGAFLTELDRRVAPGGELFVSAYVTPTKDFNPYHYSDFRPSSVRRLLRRHGYLPMSELIQIKRLDPGRSLSLMRHKKTDEEDRSGPRSLARFYLLRPHRGLLRAISLLRDGFTIKNLVVRARRRNP